MPEDRYVPMVPESVLREAYDVARMMGHETAPLAALLSKARTRDEMIRHAGDTVGWYRADHLVDSLIEGDE